MASIINQITERKTKEGMKKMGVIGIVDATLVWAKVQEPDYKYKSTTEKEYSVVVFVDEDTKDILENDLVVNKQFALVGKTKRKGKIVYPTASQVDEGSFHYGDYEGMWGFKLTCAEYDKKGEKLEVVVAMDGKKTKALIGNGSKGLVKVWAWEDPNSGMLNTRLNGIKVTELVEYEGGSDDGFDDLLGIKHEKKSKEDEMMDFGDTDDSVPFDTEDDSDLY